MLFSSGNLGNLRKKSRWRARKGNESIPMRGKLSTAFERRLRSSTWYPCLTRRGSLRTLAGLQIAPPCACFGARFAPRDFSHEAHLSAQQSTSSENSRVSGAHGHAFRPRRACTSPCQGPQAPERLVSRFTCTRPPGRLLRRSVSTTNQTSTASIRMHVALPMRCLPSLCERMRELRPVSGSP